MLSSCVQLIGFYLVGFQLSPAVPLSGMANKCCSEPPFHRYCVYCSGYFKFTSPLNLSSIENSNTAFEMKPAFCYKTFHGIAGVKEDHQCPWPRNRAFTLGADTFGEHSSFMKASSTKLPNFVASPCIQHTFKDQETKKCEGHNFNYFSAIPPSRPKSRRFSMTYVALIASAILRFPEKRLTLSQIYQVIEKIFPEFTVTRAGWKNTVRHNLSLHECFVKGEMAANGKSCYWHIHPAYIARFSKGDFRKRPSRELCMDEHTGVSRVGFDRTQPFTMPYAFGGTNAILPYPSSSQALYPAPSDSALTSHCSTTAHSSTEWLREYKPYPYYYLFSPAVNAPPSSHQRAKTEKSLRVADSFSCSSH